MRRPRTGSSSAMLWTSLPPRPLRQRTTSWPLGTERAKLDDAVDGVGGFEGGDYALELAEEVEADEASVTAMNVARPLSFQALSSGPTPYSRGRRTGVGIADLAIAALPSAKLFGVKK